jgi:hypothetical protein
MLNIIRSWGALMLLLEEAWSIRYAEELIQENTPKA